jgi:ribosomal protein S18 acetylase RimI-like enzyme
MELLQKKAEPYVTEYGENQLPGAGQLLNSILRTGTEMVPGVGDLLGAEDLQAAAQNNDWGGIGLGALAAIPGIPAIGRGVRGEARAARGVANTVADAVPTNQPMTEAESALARYRAANPNDTGARVLSPGDEGYPTNAQWDEASQTYVAPVEIRGGEIYRGDTRVGRVRLSETGGSLSIDDIEISPSLRSQGIGSDVIRQLQERARQEGRPLTLTSDAMRGTDAQQRQRSLYERLGFEANTGPGRVSERIGSRNVAPEYVWRGETVAPVEPDYPIRAYHGSPHSFDRFSLDKIGTGEGAQAYGHGLYFAESEDVARGYRDALQQSLLSLGGDIVTDNPRIARLAKAYPSADSAIQGVRGQLARAENTLATSTDDLDRMIAEADINEARTTLAELEPYAGQWFDKTPTGSMYEVGINADPAAFLDYDAPLSRQPENVRRVLGYQGNLPPPPDREIAAIIRTAMRQAEGDASQVGMIVDNDYGLYQRALEHARQQGVEADSAGDYIDSVAGDYLRQLSLRDARADDLRSLYMGREQELLDAGVPGVRYRDGFSRGNETADSPTSNYVLFNDDLVKILRKYGIGGLSTTVGASALAEELDRRGQNQEF